MSLLRSNSTGCPPLLQGQQHRTDKHSFLDHLFLIVPFFYHFLDFGRLIKTFIVTLMFFLLNLQFRSESTGVILILRLDLLDVNGEGSFELKK